MTMLMMLMLTGVLMLTGDNYAVDDADAYRCVDADR